MTKEETKLFKTEKVVVTERVLVLLPEREEKEEEVQTEGKENNTPAGQDKQERTT
jgi:hypothetical protein